MSRRRQIYEGKAKVLFEGPEPGTLVQYFKDDASAFNNQKRGTITGKGVLNNRISEFLMTRLAEIGAAAVLKKNIVQVRIDPSCKLPEVVATLQATSLQLPKQVGPPPGP